MVYCSRCGTQNDEHAKYCQNCGHSLQGKHHEDEWDRQCEESCHGSHGFPVFWGIIIILIGLWIIVEFVIKNIPGIPDWLTNFPIWGLFALIIGIFIIMFGVRVLSKK